MYVYIYTNCLLRLIAFKHIIVSEMCDWLTNHTMIIAIWWQWCIWNTLMLIKKAVYTVFKVKQGQQYFLFWTFFYCLITFILFAVTVQGQNGQQSGVRYITEDLIRKVCKEDSLEMVTTVNLTLTKAEAGKKIKVKKW
jgi:hypothetical protein